MITANAFTRFFATTVPNATSLQNMPIKDQHKLASIIKKGPSNSNPGYASAIDIFTQSDETSKNAFLNDSVVQRKLLKGLMKGDVKEPVVIEGLKTCTPCISPEEQNKILDEKLDYFVGTVDGCSEIVFACKFFTDPDAQQTIAQAIYEKCFASYPTLSMALVEKIATFTEPKAKSIIAKAVCENCLKNVLEVRLALVKQLPVLCTDPKAQQIIAEAVREKSFGNEPEVQLALAEQLSVLFTNPKEKIIIAEAIRAGCFGNQFEQSPRSNHAFTAVMKQFSTMFSEAETQWILAQALLEGCFGEAAYGNVDSSGRLKMLVEQLAMFTDPEARKILAKAIAQGCFGTNSDVLIPLIDHLPMFTDPDSQQFIAGAINTGCFGLEENVRTALIEKLVIFTDPKALQTIAEAICNGRLGHNQELCAALGKKLGIFHFSEQRTIANGIFDNFYGGQYLVDDAMKVFTDPEALATLQAAKGRFTELNTLLANTKT